MSDALDIAKKLEPGLQNSLDACVNFRNVLLNASFKVNQREYVSGTNTIGANEFTLDRWKVITTGQNISWSDSGGVRTVTAPAGGVAQVIEGDTLVSGTYTINWTGTATATVDGVAKTKGATFTVTAGTNVTVVFAGGTVAEPQVEKGTVNTVFEDRPYTVELKLCQRYFVNLTTTDFTGTTGFFGLASCNVSTVAVLITDLPVEMRAVPALEVIGSASTFYLTHAGTDTVLNFAPTMSGYPSSKRTVVTEWQVASGLTAGRVAIARTNNHTSQLRFSADI